MDVRQISSFNDCARNTVRSTVAHCKATSLEIESVQLWQKLTLPIYYANWNMPRLARKWVFWPFKQSVCSCGSMFWWTFESSRKFLKNTFLKCLSLDYDVSYKWGRVHVWLLYSVGKQRIVQGLFDSSRVRTSYYRSAVGFNRKISI